MDRIERREGESGPPEVDPDSIIDDTMDRSLKFGVVYEFRLHVTNFLGSRSMVMHTLTAVDGAGRF